MKMTKKLALFALMFLITLVIPSYIPQHHVFGKILLPMHLTVLLSAYIIGGPMAMVIGAAAPIARHYIVGFPAWEIAFPMCFELAVYGLVAGVLYSRSDRRGKDIVKSLLIAMLAGRIVWVVANIIMGHGYTFVMFVNDMIASALPGVILQLFVVSLVVYSLKKHNKIK